MKRFIKYTDKDSGIAIMFSLMMLAVFLVLGMGFSAYMTNVRRAASFQKNVASDTDIFAVLEYQVRIAMSSGFANSDYSSSTPFTSSFPEGAPSKYASCNFIANPGGPTVETNNSEPLSFPLWGIRATTTDHNIDDSEIFFTFPAPQDHTVSTLHIESSSFSSPYDNSQQGWQAHYEGYEASEESDDFLKAISTWQIIGLSGRVNPNAGYTNSTLPITTRTSSRSAGTSINEMNLEDMQFDSDPSTNTDYSEAVDAAKTEVLFEDFFASYIADGGAMNDTVYFSFFPIPSTEAIERVTTTEFISQTHKQAANTLFDLSTITDSSDPEIIAGVTAGTALTYLVDASSTSSLSEEQRVQIAANLKDYIDPDVTPSIPASFDATNPSTLTYFGNEAYPYINEITLFFTPTLTINNADPTNIILTQADIKVEASVELCEIYGVADTIDNITFEVDYSVTIDNSVTLNSSSLTNSGRFTTAAISATANTYTSTPKTIAGATPLTQSPNVTISSENPAVTITINSISLVIANIGGVPVDIANLSDLTGFTQGLTTKNMSTHISIEAKDPKNNTLSEDWVVSSTWDTHSAGPLSTSAVAVGLMNTVYLPTGGDKELEGSPPPEPWEASTNYIRNANMMNLHELGYISRGLYQTLNLVEYNMESPDTIDDYTHTGSNENLYSEINGGDRSILDHVSLGSAVTGNVLIDNANTTTSYDDTFEETTPNIGRINPNTYNRAVFKMLFSNISAEHPTASGTRVGASSSNPISDTQIEALMKKFPGFETQTQDFTPGSTWPSIGYFDAAYFKNFTNNPPSYGLPFKLALDNGELTDREAEVLIGNTRRLVSINQTHYLAYQEVRGEPVNYNPTDRLTFKSQTKKEVYYVRDLIDTGASPTYNNQADDQYKTRNVTEVTRP